jgi:ABC-type sugar transport system ATPase subunit
MAYSQEMLGQLDIPQEIPMGTVVLRVENIYRNFSFVQALINVSMDLKAGEIHALVGGNGAGKSTLVNIVCGYLKQTSGDVYIYGQKRDLKSPRDARKLGIGTVHQQLAMVENFDVTANLFLGRELIKPPPLGWLKVMELKKMAQIAEAEIRRLHISLPSVKEQLRKLSGGQRQGVACAQALMGNTPIMIMDEPTAALGVKETSEVIRLIEQCRDDGIAIMLISHNMKEVFAISQRITVLRLGEVVAAGRLTNTLTEEDVVGLITGAIGSEHDIPLRTQETVS